MPNLPNTTFVCQNSPQKQVNNEYYGNRGINLIRDNFYTADLANAVPSANAVNSIVYKAFFQDTQTIDVTIWLKGFFSPKKDSFYEFSINTNGQAQLFISTDSTSANKVLFHSVLGVYFVRNVAVMFLEAFTAIKIATNSNL